MIHRHTENMEMTREHISFTLIQEICCYLSKLASALKELQLLAQSLRKSSATTPWSLKLVTVPSFCPFTLIYLWMSLALFVIWSSQHCFLSYTLCRFCRYFQLGVLLPAFPQLDHLCHWQPQIGYISVVYGICPSCSFRALDVIPLRKLLKRVGDRRHS